MPNVSDARLVQLSSGIFAFANNAALPANTTLTRASVGQVFDSTLALVQKSTDVARFANDLTTTVPLGLLVETARTNSIRNSTATGATPGTPGTPPTNWQLSSAANGVTTQVVGTGTEDGIEYCDIRFFGTPSASSNMYILADAFGQVAALSGDVWTGSFFAKLVAGSLSNVTVDNYMIERNSGLSIVASSNITITPTSAPLKRQRSTNTRTLNNAGTAFVTNQCLVSYSNGAAFDITLRIGLPQLELGQDASSPIKTSTVAVARSADIVRIIDNNLLLAQTWVIRGRTPLVSTTFNALLTIALNTSNYLLVYRDTTGNMRVYNKCAGIVTASLTLAVVANDSDFAIAVRIKDNDITASLNGAAIVTNTSTILPTGLNTIMLGSSTGIDSSGNWNATIKQIDFRARAEVDASLRALSTL
jgi:hypothetical protein